MQWSARDGFDWLLWLKKINCGNYKSFWHTEDWIFTILSIQTGSETENKFQSFQSFSSFFKWPGAFLFHVLLFLYFQTKRKSSLKIEKLLFFVIFSFTSKVTKVSWSKIDFCCSKNVFFECLKGTLTRICNCRQ